MRGALFGVLGDVDGLTVLDAFAGSGALGFEAASRGATQVVALESDAAAQRTIKRNISALGLEDTVALIKASANAWLQTTETTFDIILCDPPYDDTQPKLLAKIAERTNTGGVVVFSLPPEETIALPPHFRLHAQKRYGDAQLLFFVRD